MVAKAAASLPANFAASSGTSRPVVKVSITESPHPASIALQVRYQFQSSPRRTDNPPGVFLCAV